MAVLIVLAAAGIHYRTPNRPDDGVLRKVSVPSSGTEWWTTVLAASNGQDPAPQDNASAEHPLSVSSIYATGIIHAIHEEQVLVPRIQGLSGTMALVWLIPNGSLVKEGDIVAEFDQTEESDRARRERAIYEDLQHQVDQQRAENRTNTEERAREMEQARAELASAELRLRAAEVLADVERINQELRREDAQKRVASLQVSHGHRESADAAALRLAELRMERARESLELIESGTEQLVVRAPLSGMVAQSYVWRNGVPGPPQIGDEMSRGQELVRIFDPTQMEVHAQIAEPDFASLEPGTAADVRLDAYPERVFRARLHSASPVATSAWESPIKVFYARFRIVDSDPRLLPELSAAVVIHRGNEE